MSYLIKGALPFTVTLIVGLTASALLGTWHFKTRYERCRHRSAVLMRMPDVEGHRCRAFGSSSMLHRSIEEDSRGSVGDKSSARIIWTNHLALDGGPVTQDAVITDLPSPHIRNQGEQTVDRHPDSRILLSVTLDSSGSVSRVDRLTTTGYTDSELDDIMAAARTIKFRPALRGIIPVSQQATVLYSWR